MPRLVTLKYGRACFFGLIALAFIGWGLYSAYNSLRPRDSVHVRLGAGSSVTRRYQIAETFAIEGRRRELFAEVVPTEGFEDSVQQIADGRLDLAMVSSGLEIPECKNVRVFAGLDLEPLHILVRRELAEQGMSLIKMIKGRTVNLGEPGTNDYMLANDVVSFMRLRPKDASGAGDFHDLSLTKDELSQLALDVRMQSGARRQALLQSLPDVVMTVASLPGVLVQTLLDTGEYCLVPFPNVEPFLMSELHNVGGPEGSVDRILIESTVVHKGMYLGDELMPQFDCPTVGLRTLLVGRADLRAADVQRVMQSLFETDFTRRIKPRTTREIATAYQVHPAVDAWLDRDKPLFTGSFFEAISELLSIVGAFTAGALSLYGYLRRRRIRRPGEYLEEIRKIDALATGEQPDPEIQISPDALAQQIDTRLNQLKEQVIRDYCDNRVQGEMVLLSILSTLADSRSRLHVAAGRPAGLRAASPEESAAWASDASPQQSVSRNSGLAA